METTTQAQLQELYQNLELIRKYAHALGILSFDFETCAPPAARAAEGETMSFLSNEAFKLETSQRMKELIVALHDRREELEPLDRVLVDKRFENYQKTKNVTPEQQLEWSRIVNQAYVDWLNAKQAGEFGGFAGSLQNIVDMSRRLVELREDALPDLYDNYLNDCEKGVLTADLDVFFAELKTGLMELLGKIRASGHVIRSDFLSRPVPVHKQEAFSRYLLELNGYDFNRGCLSTTEHPFTAPVARDDARVTTHYHEDMVLSNIFSVIHEGGHAIFMQNEPEEDFAHFINDSISNGMHESVSRFYENVIGRSEAYIHLIYPKFQELFGQELGDVSERELYEAVNIVEPSLIRTEADEVTYGLHIVIRYEMEKALLDGSLSVAEVPETWNRKYTAYLGITPDSDRTGALQDVHWTSGFGYFPSYALGNAYNAMYLKAIQRDMDFYGAIREGDFRSIKEWMIRHVFRQANVLTPKQWLKELTGRDLTAKDFLDYLNEKYSAIYELT